jgi:hypothetical protein
MDGVMRHARERRKNFLREKLICQRGNYRLDSPQGD